MIKFVLGAAGTLAAASKCFAYSNPCLIQTFSYFLFVFFIFILTEMGSL